MAPAKKAATNKAATNKAATNKAATNKAATNKAATKTAAMKTAAWKRALIRAPTKWEISKTKRTAKNLADKKRPAMTAVLRINELVENIIAHLDPPSIKISKGVCKTWKDLIAISKAIRRATILFPIISECKYTRYQEVNADTSIPRYRAPAGIQLHPNLEVFCIREPWQRLRVSMLPFIEHECEYIGHSTMRKIENLFATFPPRCAIGMRYSYCQLGRSGGRAPVVDTVVYVPDGVRIRDLVLVARALSRQENGFDDYDTSDVNARLAW